MFSTVWFLARKDVQYMLRQKETLFWTFLMPAVFFFFIGTITGGFDGSGGPSEKDPLVVEVDPRAGFLASNLEQRLSEVGFRVLSVSQVPEDTRVSRLRIPAAFSDSVLAGKKTPVTLILGSSGLGDDYDKFRIQRAIFTLLGDMVAVSEGGKPPTEEALSIITQAPKTLKLEVSKAGLKRDHIPSGFEQAIPGTMVMFTLLVLLTSGSILLVIERKERLLQRLGAAPLSRPAVILGKWGGRFLMGLIQLGFAMLIGTLLFGMRWGPNIPMLVVVLLFYAGLVALLGMLLGNLARTEGQAVGIGGPGLEHPRRPGRMLVAHRDHSRLDAEAGHGPSHGVDHGRPAQARKLRRPFHQRHPPSFHDSDRIPGRGLARHPYFPVPITAVLLSR